MYGSRFIYIISLIIISFLVHSCEKPRNRLPNIIIIFTDDQGYADVGCFGARNFSTPNLDRMATDGIRFTNFYTAASICTPSRAALLTGCYPPRISITQVAFPEGPSWTKKLSNFGLHDQELTIAEMLKPLGYATACIGKWHLGYRKPFLPTRHGFDIYFGIPYSNDMRPENNSEYPDLPLMEGENVIEINPDQSQLTKRYTDTAIDFISQNQDKPFFLYLPHTMPHVPLYVSDKFQGISSSGIYGDVISEIDWSVGEITKKIHEMGLDENTLIIYTSDNGPWLEYGNHGGSAGELREGKFTTFEGGQRVPCIMKWTGTIPENSASDQIICTLDILPTLAAITGAKLPSRQIDGQDVSGHLKSPQTEPSPREIFFYYSGYDLQAVRSEQWKLHKPHPYTSVVKVGHDGQGGEMTGKRTDWELYDLHHDIKEKHNLADRHPDVVNQLTKMMEEFDQQLNRTKRPAGVVELN